MATGVGGAPNCTKRLEQICEGISSDLFRAARALAVYNWIADNADDITSANHSLSFGTVQTLCLGEIFASLGRVYDESKAPEPICIKVAVRELGICQLKNKESFIDFIAWVNPSAAKKLIGGSGDLLSCGLRIIRANRPTMSNSIHVQGIMNVRHGEIAHRSLENVEERAKWQDIDHCIEWGTRFVAMAAKAFADRNFAPEGKMFWEGDIDSSVLSFRRLAHKAGAVMDKALLEHDQKLANSIEWPNPPSI